MVVSTGKRSNTGIVLAGGIVLLVGGLLLTRNRASASVDELLAKISAASTLTQLSAVQAEFEQLYTEGKLTQLEYDTLIAAYMARYEVISGGGDGGGGDAAKTAPYLSQIAAATTIAQLDAVYAQIEADYTSGVITPAQYTQLYNAYVARRASLYVPYPGMGTLKVTETSGLVSRVLVDGVYYGNTPFSRPDIAVGPRVITFEPIYGYAIPDPQTVTIIEDGTTEITVTYIAVPEPTQQQVTPIVGWYGGSGTVLPASNVIMQLGPEGYAVDFPYFGVDLNYTGPTEVVHHYRVDVFVGSTKINSVNGAIGGPGQSNIIFTLPGGGVQIIHNDFIRIGTPGTYPISVKIYKEDFTLFGEYATTLTLTVQAATPLPTGQTVQEQLASCWAYVSGAGIDHAGDAIWVMRQGETFWRVYHTIAHQDTVGSFVTGDQISMYVTAACSVTHNGITTQLWPGWNTITW